MLTFTETGKLACADKNLPQDDLMLGTNILKYYLVICYTVSWTACKISEKRWSSGFSFLFVLCMLVCQIPACVSEQRLITHSGVIKSWMGQWLCALATLAFSSHSPMVNDSVHHCSAPLCSLWWGQLPPALNTTLSQLGNSIFALLQQANDSRLTSYFRPSSRRLKAHALNRHIRWSGENRNWCNVRL